MSLYKMEEPDKDLLIRYFNFYKDLSGYKRLNFNHRVLAFVKDKQYVSRGDLEVTNEMKLLISAHAIILTFGFRDFFIGLIDQIFIYPDKIYSTNNGKYNKGEMNPRIKVLVISWAYFKEGIGTTNGKKSLSIQEFTHAIHLNSMKEGDVSFAIFTDGFKELTCLLNQDELLRQKLLNSRFFRGYDFFNQFEFLAVILEHFLESPEEFTLQFPQICAKTKQMMNFEFNGC